MRAALAETACSVNRAGEDGKLAVSLEQAGGSPTGSPQGQVLLATPIIRAG